MRRICKKTAVISVISIFIMLFSTISYSATYYLSPSGNDTSGSGTIGSPWFTLNKVWTVLGSGDTVYLRGGTYAFNTQQSLSGKNGTSGNLINILAYQNEIPILTKSGSYTTNLGIFFSGNYFHWKGVDISGYTQISTSLCSAIRVENSSYNIFENLKVHGNGGGMTIVNNGYTLHATGNQVLNCDFYENQDPLTTGDAYGNSDGLSIAWITHPEDINTVTGCRFWWNSDDGFDMFSNDGQVIIENCQAFYNGYLPKSTYTPAGDGMGFKFGNSLTDHRNDIKRVVKNCISVKNRGNGFTTNSIYGIVQLYNCTAYLNGNIGIHLADYNLAHVAKNCLSYSNTINVGLSTSGTSTTNSWQNGISVSGADFISTDLSLLLTARQPDGSLPDTNFLKLTSTSDLINSGTNVGILYTGSAPDLGVYEYSSVQIAPTQNNVTGGGSYCSGGPGVTVGLDNSQTGVTYQLKFGSVNNGTALAGSGSALSFGNKTVAGVYTVVATNVSTAVTANMTGGATVTVNPLPVVTFTGGITPVSAGSTNNVYTTQAGMSNYLWIVSSGGTITSGGGSSNNTVSVTWNTAGAQSISVNYTNGNGCAASSTTNYPITVNALPTVYNVTGGGSYTSGGSGVAVGLTNSQIGVNYQLKLGVVNDGSVMAGLGSALSFGNKTVAGTYTVVATNASTSSTANMTGSALVTVNLIPTVVTGVSISLTSASIPENTTQQLTATVSPSNATNLAVSWSSNNTSVATVNSIGLVTGLASGSAIITVTTQDGSKTATSAITVSNGGSAYLGYKVEGASSDGSGKGDMNASKFTAGSSFTASAMYFSMPFAVIGKIKGAIYSDNNGNLGRLLGQTSEMINPIAGGFLKLTGLNVSIKSGTKYWLVLWCNAAYKIECETTGGTYKWKVSQTYGAWPSTFPIPDGSSGLKYSIYVDGGLKSANLDVSTMVTKSLSNSIENLSENVKIDVFPNPSTGNITVRYSELPDAGSRIEILDISGRKVASRLITETSEAFTLDQEAPGLYLVKSILGSTEIIQKLIINK